MEWLMHRPYGAALLNVAKLRIWMDSKDLRAKLPGSEYLPVEQFLVDRYHDAMAFVPHEQACVIAQHDHSLFNEFADAMGPDFASSESAHALKSTGNHAHFTNSSRAYSQWRDALKAAIDAGELVLYDYTSKLPVSALTAPVTVSSVTERTLSKQPSQAARILELLVENNFTPLNVVVCELGGDCEAQLLGLLRGQLK